MAVNEMQHRQAVVACSRCAHGVTHVSQRSHAAHSFQVLVNSFGGAVFAVAAALQAMDVPYLQSTKPAVLMGGFLVSMTQTHKGCFEASESPPHAHADAGTLCLLLC